MKKYFSKLIWSGFIALASIVSVGCQKDDATNSTTTLSSDQQVMAFMDTLMHSIYLWNDSVPNLNFRDYSSPSEYLDALMYKKRDRWSFITTTSEATSYFDEGVDYGYGFLPSVASDGTAYVALVYEGSPMYKAGVRRGYKLTYINQKSISELKQAGTLVTELSKSSNRFKFTDTLNNTLDVMVAAESYTIKTVLYNNLFIRGAHRIGYLVINSFINPSVNELNEVFKKFSAENVNEFVLDLRYNGGGVVDVAKYLAEYLAPASADNQVFGSYKFNSYYSSYDSTFYYNRNANALTLNKLCVITTSNTASASEMIINCLRPYMSVVLIGSTTHGKPVGMGGFEKDGYTIFPIIFKIVNKNGSGDYYSGLSVDASAADNVTVSWGSENETCLKTAINYLVNGTFTKSASVQSQFNPLSIDGFRQNKGCY